MPLRFALSRRLSVPALVSAVLFAVLADGSAPAGRAAAGEAAGEDVFIPPAPRPRPRRNGEPGYLFFRQVREDLIKLPSFAVPCPVCQYDVNVIYLYKQDSAGKRVPDPDWTLPADDLDADLCPYSIGRIRFNANIPFCPSCGYAAFLDDFLAWHRGKTAFPAGVAEWIRRTLEPDIRLEQRLLVGAADNDSPEEIKRRLLEVFDRQEFIPDYLRCESARAVYEQLNAPGWLRAKILWHAAWAHRRAMLVPSDAPYMVRSLEAVLREIDPERAKPGEGPETGGELDWQIARLRDFLEKRRGDGQPFHSFHKRALARVMIAGLYNRRGYQGWARIFLEGLEKELTRQFPLPTEDPLWADTVPEPGAAEKTVEEREEETRVRRMTLLQYTRTQLAHLSRETLLLREAGEWIRRNLAAGDVYADRGQVAAHMFLVGEFARRSGEHPRAWLWLAAANAMNRAGGGADGNDNDNGGGDGLELMAGLQLEELKSYLEISGLKPPDFENDANLRNMYDAEIQLANQLVRRYR